MSLKAAGADHAWGNYFIRLRYYPCNALPKGADHQDENVPAKALLIAAALAAAVVGLTLPTRAQHEPQPVKSQFATLELGRR
jgi:hypothetical protein